MNKKHFIFLTIIISLFACKKESHQALNINPFADEPPRNTFLADSPWPITHCNNYAQASSPFPGPSNNNCTTDFKTSTPGIITIVISSPYPNGTRVLWTGNGTHIVKAVDTGRGFSIIALKQKENVSLTSILNIKNYFSGAYTFIDKDNIFYNPSGTKINAYGDQIAGDPFSGIELLRSFTIPANLISSDEQIVGMTMTYDGHVVFATNNGLVGLTDRNFSMLKIISFPDEEISNSIACDEEQGIYVVTSKKMYRVQWTGTELTIDENKGGWSAEYENGIGTSGIRLGAGSGSTPTLMGIGNNDKFVVITDGQPLMHLVLLWRDQIPSNWQQIPNTKSRRIAAQIPIRFGNPSATKTLSEQSVCVRGYGAMVVNNELKNSTDNKVANILLSGNPGNAPYGLEKFEWNPTQRKLRSVWANTSVSFPSGIPCMSAATNLAYCMGQNNGVWNFSAINWSTGQTVFEYPLGNNLQYNSAYAATEIGLNKGLYSGTLLGVTGVWQK